jgi:hypothetical protein
MELAKVAKVPRATGLRLFLSILFVGGLTTACDISNTDTYEQGQAAPEALATDVPLAPDEVNGVQPASPAMTPADVAAAEANLPPMTLQRIADLQAIAKAAEAYKARHGSYPNSGGAYAAYKMSWGLSKGEDWLPELVPEFLAKAPRDPSLSEDPDGPQYLYASDGSYFKVIAHATGDCDTATGSPRVMRDPIRTRADGTCWAYGLWSANGKSF